MDRTTILADLESLGVDVNGLVVPGRSAERALARYAFPLVVNNNHKIYKFRLVGSATAIRFRGRYVLLCTSHQLKGEDPEQIAMLKDDGSVLVTSGGFRSRAPSPHTDAFDIAAFDFTEPVAAHPDLRKRFFELSAAPPDTLNTHVLGMLLTGYPSQSQDYDLEENNHIGFARLNVTCTPDGQPPDLALLRLRAVTPLNLDPDGLSGGSAFVIHANSGGPRAYFAGIVLQGGRELFHILKVGYVLEFLDVAFPAA